MFFYLTYNDSPSGIYSSQVIDVVKFINLELKAQIKLIAFISIRGFLGNRKRIRIESPNAIVVPMFPGVHRWMNNSFFLEMLIWFYKPHTIIGRSVFATQLALRAKRKNKIKKVVYDGRAAVKAEWEEYNVITNKDLLNSIFELEKQCVLQADYRISVSQSLVTYWEQKFNYKYRNHVIIPCTINSVFESIAITNETVLKNRKALGFSNKDVVFVYSGSVAAWQSIRLMIDFIKTVLQKNTLHKMLFLSELTPEIQQLKTDFPHQVQCKKVLSNEVPQILVSCDYGLLIREHSITNQVASPVKFAEYLACGLDVIISDQIGDYSNFVQEKNCGFLYKQFSKIETVSIDKKLFNQKLAKEYFTKRSFEHSYSLLL